ncbi:hypothetical protein SAMN05421504_1034 [Amycolatopsis xylanica]|uniref:Helix-turn-helix n=1 Tax=Amycolatopsis xylanica TaxID=589385 RepID=A0A1H3CDX6_9PSEU|nr:helix-turn-helix transcriptional regulator [Amycolatopsis xylanica]SDX52402.1 hypothetical protein SAMN05421504_1034 [Amycolatopsis xylanica]
MTQWQAARWAETVRAGLKARGLSLDEAARQVGVPTSTLRSWIEHRHAPKVTIFDHWTALAKVTGLGEAELLQAAGVLPDSLTSSIHLAQATKSLRDGIEEAGRFLRRADSLVSSSSMSQVINELSASRIDWELRMRTANRGEDVPLTLHHYVGVVPPPDLPLSGEEARDLIERDVLGHLWRPLGLYWRRLMVHDWADPPRLIIQVAEQESTHPPSTSLPVVDAPPMIVFAPVWGYGYLMGSLIADALGFGNVDFRYFGMPDSLEERLEWVGRELADVSPRFVKAVPPTMFRQGLRVHTEGYLPICVTYGPRMREHAVRVYRDVLLPDSDIAIRENDEIRERIVAGLPSRIDVRIDDADVVDGDTVNRHKINDTVAWLSEQIVEHLLLASGLPPVPLGGPLRQLVLPSGRVQRPPALASTVSFGA